MHCPSSLPALLRLATLAVALATAAAFASDEENGRNSAQNDPAERVETVTVYGTTNPLPVFDYPGHVTVIDRAELETRAPSSMADALRDVPGLDFRGGPRRTGELPALRGLTGENVLVLLDGARQNFISAHDGRFFVDPELVGKIEVLRGPASALYGSGAVAGILAIESVSAADLSDQPIGVRLRTGYQSANDEALASVTGFAQRGGFDGIASFGIRRSGDIALGSGLELPSDDEIGTALLKASQTLTDALSLEASWQRFGNTAIEPNNGQGVLGTGNGVLDREVEKDILSDSYRAGLRYDPLNNDWVDFSLTAYVADTEVEEFDQTVPRTTLRQLETFGLSLRNSSRFSLGGLDTTVTVGADRYWDQQNGADDRNANGSRDGVPDAESDFTGVFAQAETVFNTPLGELLLIPGLRYDRFESSPDTSIADKNEDEAVSARFAAGFTPAELDWLRLFGSYSEAFRAPSVNELYLTGVHFSVPHPVLFNPARGSRVFVSNNFIPNANLLPEQTETLEFGFGLDFASVFAEGDRIQAKASRFDSDAEDLINISVAARPDRSCFAPPRFQPCTFGTSGSANVDRAELSGWEAELAYHSDRLFARLAYSSVEGTDLATGADLGSLTPNRLALDLGVSLPPPSARIGLRLQLADDFERLEPSGDNNSLAVAEQRDGYAVLDLYATWQPRFSRQLRIDFGIDNVLDKDYERVFQGVSEPGRNFKLAASWQFDP